MCVYVCAGTCACARCLCACRCGRMGDKGYADVCVRACVPDCMRACVHACCVCVCACPCPCALACVCGRFDADASLFCVSRVRCLQRQQQARRCAWRASGRCHVIFVQNLRPNDLHPTSYTLHSTLSALGLNLFPPPSSLHLPAVASHRPRLLLTRDPLQHTLLLPIGPGSHP